MSTSVAVGILRLGPPLRKKRHIAKQNKKSNGIIYFQRNFAKTTLPGYELTSVVSKARLCQLVPSVFKTWWHVDVRFFWVVVLM
jgi:hypothetical protein